MPAYDIFNGDADGLCALRQLRLHEALDAQLVTGAKREIALVSRVQARAGDRLTVLDISLHENREALLAALEAGRHLSVLRPPLRGRGAEPSTAAGAHQLCAEVCTSLLVDAWLGGAYRAWAVAAAFGDNLPRAAAEAAQPLRLNPDQLDTLRSLGECLNYNAYGDSVEDLYFHPGTCTGAWPPSTIPWSLPRATTRSRRSRPATGRTSPAHKGWLPASPQQPTS